MTNIPADIFATARLLADKAACFGYTQAALDIAHALLAEREHTPDALPASKEAEAVAFGEGKLVIDTGTFHSRPAVFIAPAKYPGEVGASADREGNDLHTLQPGEIVLTFPTDEQARAVEAALFAHPPTDAGVSEAMVDSALVAYYGGPVESLRNLRSDMRRALRAALSTAMVEIAEQAEHVALGMDCRQDVSLATEVLIEMIRAMLSTASTAGKG